MPLFDDNIYDGFHGEWYLCHYVPHSDDYLTSELLEFKNGNEVAIATWSNWLVDEVKWLYDHGVYFDYCVRILGSNELFVPDPDIKPLGRLISNLTNEVDIMTYPDLLSKSRVTNKFAHIATKRDREKEIQDVYRINVSTDLSNSRILILDDIKTSGTTSHTVCDLIKSQFDDVRCYLFTLGRTNRNVSNSNALQNKFRSYLNLNNGESYAANDDLPF